MTPTPEQDAVRNFARESSDNMLVNALAGAAKTSTLVLIAEALPDVQMLCLAFNKKIATEMQMRLPRNCTARTLNSIGHSVWQDAIGRRLKIEPSKIYDLFSAEISKMSGDEKTAAYDRLGELMNVVRFGKSCGYIPDDYPRMKPLMTDDEFWNHLDEELEDWEINLCRTVYIESLNQAWQGVCDYDDQILMPTLSIGAFPRYPLVMVDEAQDLSALNHAMLVKLVKKRLIAVGDERQAIYGFRGAHEDSMKLLKERFSMTEFTLSISFRCPKAVVEAARWRAPHMQYPEWAKEGTVTTLPEWSETSIPDNAAIICRNNAPLFSMAIKLLKNGRYPELYGNDIGKNLLKIMKKFGSPNMLREEVLEAISKWREEKLAKTRARGTVEDQAACLTVFAEVGDTLADAMAYAEHVFSASGPIKLMTVHKAKGLEFDDVYFLDAFLIGKENQEPNLRYVAQTRAKSTLTYIKSEDFTEA